MTTLKIFSWNVNGIRAAERKGYIDWLQSSGADIAALQETKVSDSTVLSAQLRNPEGFQSFFHCATEKKGYSGVAIYTKINPKKITTIFSRSILATEGRLIECDFGDFMLLNCYFPNGGMGPDRLKFKLQFYEAFLAYVKSKKKKGIKIIICGDVNTAHKAIDLARPKDNEGNTGFLPEERAWIDEVIKSGYYDTFRSFHTNADMYTYWDMKTFARDRNVGWRIDYFFADEKLSNCIIGADIHSTIFGSDHCPVSIKIQTELC